MSSGYPLDISFFRLGSRLCFSAPVSRIDTQIDLVDRSWTRAGGRAKFTEKAVRPVPTSVTSSPSRIHVMPTASTINQCHRLQGSRSMRSATSVSTYSGETISFSLLDTYQFHHALPDGIPGAWPQILRPSCLANQICHRFAPYGPSPFRQQRSGIAAVAP
jgi:hypothetical protein